jgi:hypothetical protein
MVAVLEIGHLFQTELLRPQPIILATGIRKPPQSGTGSSHLPLIT